MVTIWSSMRLATDYNNSMIIIMFCVCTDYVLSPTPLLLRTHPESVSVVNGDSVSFNCSLSNEPAFINGKLHYYPIVWRHNGTVLSTEAPSHWSVDGEWPLSRLTVTNITIDDHGYYECMALDGLNDVGVSVSVTVSKRGWLNRGLVTQQGKGFKHIFVSVLGRKP